MFALLRAAPAIRRGLYARPRLFSSSSALFVKTGIAVKAPRWVNSRQPQDTPPAHEEDDSNEPDEPGPTENSDPSSSNSESPSSSTGDSSSSASPPSNPPPPSTPGSIAKQSVPKIYSQVLALPESPYRSPSLNSPLSMFLQSSSRSKFWSCRSQCQP